MIPNPLFALAPLDGIFGIPHGVLSSPDKWHVPVVVVLLVVGGALARLRG